MAKIRIKQVRSLINRPQSQRDTIKALGLGKINSVSERESSPQIAGMVRKVLHLIEVEEVK